MTVIGYIYKAIISPLGLFNRENGKGKLASAITIVTVTAVSNSAIVPALYYFTNRYRYDIGLNIGVMVLNTFAGILTWLIACLLFWTLSKYFKKALSFSQIASTWGYSYIPNFLCIAAFSLLQLRVVLYNGSAASAFFISAFFIMLLAWKAIYYFMLMRFVIGTTASELAIITVVSAAAFAALMVAGFKLGIQIPML